jgi:hypothetical protein
MEAACGWIVGVKVDARVENATKVQEVLTQYGCSIKARLGLHETSKDYCANFGIIILQCCGCGDEVTKLVDALNGVDGVCAKSMCLD